MSRKHTESNHDTENGIFEVIESEEADRDSSPPTYEINVYPADYTLEMLNTKLKAKELKLPEFQRSFVWTLKQSSKLIESFLLGLPVPPIFLYVDKEDGKFLVVDGQQRLKTIQYFFDGNFGEPVPGGKRQVFSLIGLNEQSKYADKTYQDLLETDEPAERKLRNAVLRSIIIKQLDPNDDTSIYHVFERLNTGGTPLKGQEIRNCIYHGKFNELLHDLNDLENWRSIFGKATEDKRQRDIELILRFFALYYDAQNYKKPMKDFLSRFMKKNKNISDAMVKQYRELFSKTAGVIHSQLGDRPFRISSGLNAAIFDAVSCAIAKHIDNIPTGLKTKYTRLLQEESFKALVTAGTTDEDVLEKRLKMANQKLFATRS